MSALKQIARRQFARRERAYRAVAIFSAEDLEQEMSLAMCDVKGTATEVLDAAKRHAARLARRGNRRCKHRPPETPVSMLPDHQRRYVENLLYSSASVDDDDFD
jgi:hypothetical protein